MTVVPGADPQTLSLVCDTCGHAVDGIESSADHWPVVWAVISREGWGGSPLAIGPHHCPACFGAATEGNGSGGGQLIDLGDQQWGATMSDLALACVVRLRGQLDILYAPELREVLLDAGKRHRNVVLDLSDVRLLDSTGLGQLVQARQLAESAGGRLCLVGPSPFLVSVLDTMRLSPMFDIFPETGDAMRWLEATEPFSG
ncbi:MAG TPA: STAS domain-containing protein [Micromonosporaceae bacterium]|nr:STAS domain-containing protein [Micromonosporaceae bacterium]